MQTQTYKQKHTDTDIRVLDRQIRR